LYERVIRWNTMLTTLFCCAGRAAASLVVLQVSDIHTSEHQQIKSHRERHEEFQLFSALVAPRIDAAAAVLTGDLVDSKSASNVASYQSEWEWRAYRNVTDVLLRSLKPTLQVPAPDTVYVGTDCSAAHHLNTYTASLSQFINSIQAVTSSDSSLACRCWLI
jgi:hypothetical protein